MAEITRVLIALIVRVGVGLAKNLIQVHALDAACRRVVARAIKRGTKALVNTPWPSLWRHARTAVGHSRAAARVPHRLDLGVPRTRRAPCAART